MTRSIPWIKQNGPSVERKRLRPTPEQRESASLENDSLDQNSEACEPWEGTKKRLSARTTSTSPPPGPPDEEFLIDGYDHDDLYIMVEDEFHSVAQTFTQHLHHAEYQRLKKKARDAGPPAFQPTQQMREETKKKMEARALRTQQKDTLANLTNSVNLSMQENEEQEDDPWLGTSLAGLMTDAGNQKRTALVGLEKVQSSTRAAKGFGRVTGSSPVDRREKMSIFDIFGAHGKGKEDGTHGQKHKINDGKLDPSLGPAKARPASYLHQNGSSDGEAGPGRPTLKVPSYRAPMNKAPSYAQSAADSKHGSRLREPPVATRELSDDLDNLDTIEHKSTGPTRPRALPSRKDRSSNLTKDRKLQIGDIPTFLV